MDPWPDRPVAIGTVDVPMPGSPTMHLMACARCRQGARSALALLLAFGALLATCQAPGGAGRGSGPTTKPGGANQPGPTNEPGGNGGNPGQPSGLPPDWIRAGVRVSWYVAGATVAQSRFAFVEDPTGEWQDPVSGKRYRRTDESGEGQPGAAGDGFSQVDVLAVEGGDVVASNTLYLLNRADGTITPLPLIGARVAGEIVDGAWIHPARLQALQDARVASLLVVRGPYAVGGSVYRAISFATTAAGNTQQYTYDLDTGVLLSATTFAQGATSPVHAVGEAPPQGNNQLTITRFAGICARTPPGLGGTTPGWAGQTSQLLYAGTQSTFNPLDPSIPALVLPMRATITLGPGGPAWATFAANVIIDSPLSQPSVSSGVTGTSGLYWIDPAAFAGLAPGQALDVDPVTTERLTVVGFDQTGSFISFSNDLPGTSTQTTYSTATGALVAYRSQVTSSGTLIDLQLQNPP